jgi:hypothetical protein
VHAACHKVHRHRKARQQHWIPLGVDRLQVLAEALFQLLKHDLDVCYSLSHATPVKLEAVAAKGDVSEPAIGREGSS